MDVKVVNPARGGTDPLERETIKRVAWRLIPLLMLGYFCAYLDRVNVGMAAPTMSPDLGFSNAVFGFGAGVFFLGYFLAEIPSNLVLDKFGARRWLARILVTWGIISALTAFVWNDWSFHIVRLCLGLAEAGYFPGVVLYLTWWFPSSYRSQMQAIFQSASVISLVIGPPIGGLLLQLDGTLGLHGWQWLFLVEGLPAVIMSVITWFLLTDRPVDADWLRPEQRAWLADRLASERAQREAIRHFSLGETLYNPKVWLLTLAGFGINVGSYGLMFFLPLIVKGLGVASTWIGLVSAIPFLFAAPAMIYWGWHSDRAGERTWHAISAFMVTTVGLAACTMVGVGHPMLTMVLLVFGAIGLQASAPVFWALPTALLTGTAAAGGLALINSVANLGGWLGPWMYGIVKDATGSDNTALLCLAMAPIVSGIAVILARHDPRMERITPR